MNDNNLMVRETTTTRKRDNFRKPFVCNIGGTCVYTLYEHRTTRRMIHSGERYRVGPRGRLYRIALTGEDRGEGKGKGKGKMEENKFECGRLK